MKTHKDLTTAYPRSSGRSVRERRQELIDGYLDWLSGFSWDWFVTLTFPGYPSRASAESKFRRWVERLRHERGRRGFRFVRVAEHGAFDDNLHFHLVVGGLKKGSNPDKWCRRWEESAGRAQIRQYDVQQNGMAYLLKTLRPDDDFDIEVEGLGAGK